MPSYDTSFSPPCPVVDVTLRAASADGPSRVLAGKLDTGADLTVIPPSLVVELQLPPAGTVRLSGYDGSQVERPLYAVDLEIGEDRIEAVLAVAAPRSNILLGRDVLNHFIITLDGKHQQFEVRDP
ncbi:MAG TPA: aspartyl protease family protein [Anaerolineae bacterium]|nr:aspartyl protease family protein [Anaerolineae bacterium]